MTVLFIIILHSVPFRINTHYCNRLFIESENNKVGLGQLGHELSDGVDPLRDGREIWSEIGLFRVGWNFAEINLKVTEMNQISAFAHHFWFEIKNCKEYLFCTAHPLVSNLCLTFVLSNDPFSQHPRMPITHFDRWQVNFWVTKTQQLTV